MKTNLRLSIVFILAFMLVACTGQLPPPTPGDPTWQLAQYDRDAQATLDAESVTRQAISRSLYATDVAATQGAINQQATLSAQSTAAEYTRQVESTATAIAYAQATATAQAQATQTEIANALATETAYANATGTQVANVIATEARAVEATSTQIAVNAQIARVEQARLNNTIGWAITFGFIIGGLVLLLWLGYVAIRQWRKQHSVVTTGPHGNPVIILDGDGGNQIIIDPMRLFGPATVVQPNGTITAPMLATEPQQAHATLLAQLLAFAKVQSAPSITQSWAVGSVSHTRTQAHRAPVPARAGIDSPRPQSSMSLAPTSAPWKVLDDWRGGHLPLGIGPSGLLLADPETSPHYLMAGTSGSGKTRFGLRPLITAALADAWQVIILDRSGLDFLPFRDHQNAVVQIIDEPTRVIAMLQSLYFEIQRRFVTLRESGSSTWSHLPAANRFPRLLCVIDEFSNLADSLDDHDREELWRWARMIAAEGRKAGVHLALALQDPTHKSLDLRIRRNCTPIAFRVKDGEASRVILGSGGAETLEPRQFMTVMGNLTRGMAFAPADDEIKTFLGHHPVANHARPEWLTSYPATPAEPVVTSDKVARIREMRAAGMSLNAIQRAEFGYIGGKAYDVVKAALSEDPPIIITADSPNTRINAEPILA